jgi:hypothetical protein
LPEVAKVLDSSEAQVREWLKTADLYLRAELAELGIETLGSKQPLSYIVPAHAATSVLEAELDEALTQSSD